MKNLKKAVLASSLAVAVGFGGFVCEMPSAEAGLLGGIGDAVGIGGGSGGKVDVKGLTERQNKLLTNLTYSAALMGLAANNMNNALGLGLNLQDDTATKNNAKNAVISGDSGAMLKCTASSLNGMDKNTSKTFQDKAIEKINSMSSAEREALKAQLKEGKTYRTASDVMIGASLLDAARILKDATSGLKSAGDAKNKLEQIIQTTKSAESLLKQRDAISKAYGNALKAYEKTTPLGKPSDAEKKKAMASVGKE